MNQKTSLQKSLFSHLSLKAISLFTVIVFLCSEFPPFPSQALAQTFSPSDVRRGTDTSLLASAPATSGNVQELVIPSDIGTINEVRCGTRSSGLVPRNGKNKNKSLVPGDESRFVVLIQDAHSIPDAQRSLQKLIEYLQVQYGVTTVALEGAEGKLDPELFRNFPDKEKLARVFESYLESGELSGAAVASVLSKFPAEYVGIEDWRFYQEGIAAFLEGLKQQAAFNVGQAALIEELKKLKEKYYSAKALEFDKRFRAFQMDFTKLPEMFKSFSGLVLQDLKAGKKYPTLQAVIENLQNEQNQNSSAFDGDIKILISRVESRLKGNTRFNQIKQAFQTGQMGRAEFAYELSRLVKDPAFFSAGLRALIASHAKLIQLKGPAFVKETDQFITDVKTKIFVSPEEKSVAELDEQLDLFRKLIRFELSREEWNKIRDSGLAPQNLLRAVKEVAEKINALKSKANDFRRFYQIAEKREAVFLKQLDDLLSKNESRGASPESRVTSVVALVTGGFHTDGLAQSFRKQGIPYAVVSPRITKLPEESHYFDYMQGKVSWQKYFRPKDGRIDLYDAFSRAAVDRLTSRRTPRPAAKIVQRTELKEWRDEIVRTLAAEGRVAKHAQYTRYIDQMLAGNSEEFQTLRTKWVAKLEKFIRSLQFLQGKNQLTEANIAKLLSQPANQVPVAVASFVPHADIAAFLFQQKELIRRSEIRKEETLQPLPAVPAAVTANAELKEYLAGKRLIHGVFKGGGAKGVAYAGALEELESRKMWFEEVAGTSAGAITAALIAVGYTYEEIKKIVFETDFNQFKDRRWGFVPPLLNFIVRGGMYRGQVFEKWMAEKLKAKLGFEPRLKDLPIPLTAIASDISNKTLLVLDRNTAPDLKVAEAVRMSMGIPFFFEVYRWLGVYRQRFPAAVRRVVDGGLLSNFPLFVYDEAGRKGKQVVGFMLQEQPHGTSALNGLMGRLLALLKKIPVLHIIIAAVETMLAGQDNYHIEDDVWAHIVNIPVHIGTLDFDLTAEQKAAEAARGKKATMEILDRALRGEKGKVRVPEAGPTVKLGSKESRVFFKPAGFSQGVRFDCTGFYRDRAGNFQANVRFRPDGRVLIQPEVVWEANVEQLKLSDGKWDGAALAKSLEGVRKEEFVSFDTELARRFVLFDPKTKQKATVEVTELVSTSGDAEKPVLVLHFPSDVEFLSHKGNVEIVSDISQPSKKSGFDVQKDTAEPLPAVTAAGTANAELKEYLAGKRLIHGVFKGGGAKGVAYVGALEELESRKMWFEQVAGTSAGAITAALIAAGYTYEEIKKIVFETDFNQFKDRRWRFVPPLLNFIVRGGMYRGQVFEKWMAEKLKAKLGFEPRLKDLPIPLTAIASDISNKTLLVLDRNTAPDLKVAEAVRMSMGIPFFFEVYRWLGVYRQRFPAAVRRVVDGGLLSNFPLFVYDEAGRKGKQVVGFMLQEQPHGKSPLKGLIGTLLAFLKKIPALHITVSVIETALAGQDNYHIEDDVWAHIVNIPVHIGTLDFDLTAEQKAAEAARGKKATMEILDRALRGEKGKIRVPEAGPTVKLGSKDSRVFFKPAGFSQGVRFDCAGFYRDKAGNFQANVRFRPDGRVLIQPQVVWEANIEQLKLSDGKWDGAALAKSLEGVRKEEFVTFNTELARRFVLFDPKTKQKATVEVTELVSTSGDAEKPVLVLHFPSDVEFLSHKGNVEVVKDVSKIPAESRSEARMVEDSRVGRDSQFDAEIQETLTFAKRALAPFKGIKVSEEIVQKARAELAIMLTQAGLLSEAAELLRRNFKGSRSGLSLQNKGWTRHSDSKARFEMPLNLVDSRTSQPPVAGNRRAEMRGQNDVEAGFLGSEIWRTIRQRTEAWLKKKVEFLCRKNSDFRLLVYLLNKVDLPPANKALYLVIGSLFAVSLPFVEPSKPFVIPTVCLFLHFYFSAWVVKTVFVILGLWMGSILRFLFIFLPLWSLSRPFLSEPLRKKVLLIVNFVPFAGAISAVMAQLWVIVREQYRNYEGVSFLALRSLNRVISSRLKPGRTALSRETLDRLTLFSPDLTFHVLDFQNRYRDVWGDKRMKVRRAAHDPIKLLEKIADGWPTLFIGTNDEYKALRQRVLNEIESKMVHEITPSRMRRYERKIENRVKTIVRREIEGNLSKETKIRLQKQLAGLIEQETSQRIHDRVRDKVRRHVWTGATRLPFYRFDADAYLRARAASASGSFEKLETGAFFKPLFDKEPFAGPMSGEMRSEMRTDEKLQVSQKKLTDVSKIADTKTLLVLDDKRIYHEKATSRYGKEYRITHVWTLEEAMRAVEENPAFDLILSDVDLVPTLAGKIKDGLYSQLSGILGWPKGYFSLQRGGEHFMNWLDAYFQGHPEKQAGQIVLHSTKFESFSQLFHSEFLRALSWQDLFLIGLFKRVVRLLDRLIVILRNDTLEAARQRIPAFVIIKPKSETLDKLPGAQVDRRTALNAEKPGDTRSVRSEIQSVTGAAVVVSSDENKQQEPSVVQPATSQTTSVASPLSQAVQPAALERSEMRLISHDIMQRKFLAIDAIYREVSELRTIAGKPVAGILGNHAFITKLGIYLATDSSRFPLILSAIGSSTESPGTVLELGSGVGKVALSLAVLNPRIKKISGIEYEPDFVEISKQALDIAQGDTSRLGLKAFFPDGKVTFERGNFLDDKFLNDFRTADLILYYRFGSNDEYQIASRIINEMKAGARFLVYTDHTVLPFEILSHHPDFEPKTFNGQDQQVVTVFTRKAKTREMLPSQTGSLEEVIHQSNMLDFSKDSQRKKLSASRIESETPVSAADEHSMTQPKPQVDTQVYEGILGQMFDRGVIERAELRLFTEKAVANLDQTVRDLKGVFDQWLPEAIAAEALGSEKNLAASYEKLGQIMAREKLNRTNYDLKAEALFNKLLQSLGTAIRGKQVKALAPVIFYSPKIKKQLVRFIETIQRSFESTGDVMAENYHIMLVSENKAELMEFIGDLSRAGLMRGVQYDVVENSPRGQELFLEKLETSVIHHPLFGDHFGVFFPNESFAKQVPVWQRVVRSEIPEEYGIVLLPALAQFFATVKTSEISATSLRQALPDFMTSATFRMGQGITIVTALLEQIVSAAREISTAA